MTGVSESPRLKVKVGQIRGGSWIVLDINSTLDKQLTGWNRTNCDIGVLDRLTTHLSFISHLQQADYLLFTVVVTLFSYHETALIKL